MEALFPSDAVRQRRLARWLGLLALALAVFLVLRALRKEGGVMELNRAFGARFLDGLDPWFDPERGRRVHGPYPPSLAWIAVPLSLLPLGLARGLWALLQLGALALLYRLLERRVREHFPGALPHVPMLFACALLLGSRFLLRDFAGGGGNVIYGALAFAGVEACLRNQVLAGALPLGLSLALKPNLAPLLLFLLLRRRFRGVLCSLAAAAAIFWLPALSYGARPYAELASSWAEGVWRYAALEDLHTGALVPAGLPQAEDGMNQSLREAVQRLLRPPGDTGAVDVHVIELSPAAAAWIARLLLGSLAVLAAVAAWRARGPAREFRALLGFFPLALLSSPITWKAHHAALVPVFFGLCLWAFEERRRPGPLLLFLCVYWLACDLLSEDVVGREAKRLLQAASVVTWFDIALVLVISVPLLRNRGEPPAGLTAAPGTERELNRRTGTGRLG